MLKDYPIRFDGENIFTPTSWEEESAVVESVNETEAGTDQLSVSASFQCSSTWAGKFKTYSKQDSITVSLYDIETHAYKNRSMRLRSFKAVPAQNSERNRGTDGLWTVSFTLEEF